MAKNFAERHFAKVAALRNAGAPSKAIRKLADTWGRRGGRATQGFYKAQAPGVCVTTKGVGNANSQL